MMIRHVVTAVVLSLSAMHGQTTSDKVRPLDPALLAGVRDDSPFAALEHVSPDEVTPDARDEDTVFWQAVENAHAGSTNDFTLAAEANRYLTFGHLYSEPSKYRGQIVHIEGRLVRLKKLDPPRHAQLHGIGAVYEAWVYLAQPGTHPVCAILASPPNGIELGDGLNHRVAVDGYFLKRYRYISGRLDSAGNNVALNTVLVIGPTARLIDRSVQNINATASIGSWYWISGVAGGAVVFLAAMVWWFHRGDRRANDRLRALRSKLTIAQSADIGDSKTPAAAA